MSKKDGMIPRREFWWDIYNPSVPPRVLEARFFSGSPTVTQWKATLLPLYRRYNYVALAFCLESDEKHGEVAVEQLRVYIMSENNFFIKKDIPTYTFCIGNRFKYHLFKRVYVSSRNELHKLAIKVGFYLEGEAKRNEEIKKQLEKDAEEKKKKKQSSNEDKEELSIDADLRRLSRDMKYLLVFPQYPNMIIKSADPKISFDVHSYIIGVRWDQFFVRHDPFQARSPNGKDIIFSPCFFGDYFEKPGSVKAWHRNVKETNISPAVLYYILHYIYSGEVICRFSIWIKPAYSTELLKVINDYELYHLYKVFVKCDSWQQRVTEMPMLIESWLFPLQIVNGRPVNNSSRTFHIIPNPEYRIIFQFRMQDRIPGWLSYSLHSNSKSTVYAEVILFLVKRMEGKEEDLEEIPLHWQDCTMKPDVPDVQSGPVQYLRCLETFGGSNSTGIEYFIRCFLNVVNGETVEQFQCVGDYRMTLQDELERYRLLSDHMHRLKNHPVDHDMQITSQKGCLLQDRITEFIHKGIFASRINRWFKGIENCEFKDVIPGVARSTLTSDSLVVVHDYMYTGKVPGMTQYVLREIRDFAEKTSFSPLLELVNRAPKDWWNNPF